MALLERHALSSPTLALRPSHATPTTPIPRRSRCSTSLRRLLRSSPPSHRISPSCPSSHLHATSLCAEVPSTTARLAPLHQPLRHGKPYAIALLHRAPLPLPFDCTLTPLFSPSLRQSHVCHASPSPCMPKLVPHDHIGHFGHILSASSDISLDDIPLLYSISI